MADPYANLRDASVEVQTLLADAIDTRASDPAQIEMRRSYLGALSLPPNARAVEFGSGTGFVTRDLIEVAGATEAIGIEPSPVLIERALARHGTVSGLRFVEADAAETGLEAESVDLVVMHTLLCHAPAAEAIVSEAKRILRPGACLTILDGDYELTSVALARHDPLQVLIGAVIDALVHDRWISRRLRSLLSAKGFHVGETKTFDYSASTDPRYFFTLIDRGADQLVAQGVVGPLLCDALKQEARRRVDRGTFFGSIPFVCVSATKPA